MYDTFGSTSSFYPNDLGFLGDAAMTRALRLPVATGVRGGTLSVPVTVDAVGNEVALMFSLHYQPSQLQNPRVSLGSGGSRFTLTVNDNGAGSGRLVVLLDADPRDPLPAGQHHVATITFDIPATATPGASGLNFASSPARLSWSDGLGNNLPALYQNGHAIVLADASDNAANYPTAPLHFEPAGYEGSYTGSDPVVVPTGGGVTGTADPPVPLIVDPNGNITHGNLGGGNAAGGTIFGFSPIVIIAAAAVGLYLFSNSK